MKIREYIHIKLLAVLFLVIIGSSCSDSEPPSFQEEFDSEFFGSNHDYTLPELQYLEEDSADVKTLESWTRSMVENLTKARDSIFTEQQGDNRIEERITQNFCGVSELNSGFSELDIVLTLVRSNGLDTFQFYKHENKEKFQVHSDTGISITESFTIQGVQYSNQEKGELVYCPLLPLGSSVTAWNNTGDSLRLAYVSLNYDVDFRMDKKNRGGSLIISTGFEYYNGQWDELGRFSGGWD